ncbi:MAG: UDP-N-acetylmuramoyl-tripeptide--D-alanyl-D-alanine ligase [Nitrospirae bacterium]|nr:UDP-N-acetylmuramoyl-tripeptide--D-alanyl-D-alanine ligase [Nitrospirota bacterium]
MEWTVGEIVKITRGRLIQGNPDTIVKRFSTDSRKIEPEAFFIPLRGDRFDGHQFIDQACQNGASGSFKARSSPVVSPGICIEVDDPLTALQEIAGEVRKHFKGPVVAITGSNGKTTTKEMLNAILAKKNKLLKSEGNFNNHIGLPLTLLGLTPSDRIILLEMGINHPGELRRLCEIARPTVGVITNIGETHLEGLGSIEGVAQAKGELLDFLGEGTAVLNQDSPFYTTLKTRQKGKRVSFGLSEGADFRGSHAQSMPQGVRFTLTHRGDQLDIQLAVPGTHNVYNALGAAAASSTLGCGTEEIVQGLNAFSPVPLRSEMFDLNPNVKVVSDAYNANPSSMEAAIRMLAERGAEDHRKTVAILGDMLELGKTSEKAHFRLGQMIGELKIWRLFLYGPEARHVSEGARDEGMAGEAVSICPTHEEIVRQVRTLFSTRSLVLVKGSRGMKMEKVLELLKKE